MPLIFGSVPILAAVAIQLLISSVSSLNITNEYLHHACNNTQGKYVPGGVFEKNLNIVLKNISTFDLRNGYALESNMDRPYKFIPPAAVFVMLQCRGDSYGPKCHSCLAKALSGLRKKCPRNRAATIWYDQCTLDIATYNSGDTRILYDNYLCMENPKDLSGDTEMFDKKKSAFTKKLLSEVKKLGKDGKRPVYATGEMMIERKKLYGMMQCTDELSGNGCFVCLDWLINERPFCGHEKQGVRYLCRSCNARFELYPFLRT
ncbi:cysteine-rich repeat secretory protein 26-like [Raphanus sativus]|uniref:Cysteine-rich repeat secretory protein 26-like n=1 Tax=Raphanus sativus TaxID=3726 RepID=A0A6J0NYT0_RAPSA|nr:cysteine-rich repeat secretory protein 26-like [Raphanus sativus]